MTPLEEQEFTPAEVQRLLGISKTTLRTWTIEYADFLSERARAETGRSRQFKREDVIALNTIRHLVRKEGMSSYDAVRAVLGAGRRIDELPRRNGGQRQQVHMLAQVEQQKTFLEAEQERLQKLSEEAGKERDLALLALDDANREISRLREEYGRQRGMLIGAGISSLIGLVLLEVMLFILISLAG